MRRMREISPVQAAKRPGEESCGKADRAAPGAFLSRNTGYGVCRMKGNFTLPFMLHYTLVFFVVAIIAAVLGFGGIAGASADIARICFFVFLILALVSLLTGKKPTA